MFIYNFFQTTMLLGIHINCKLTGLSSHVLLQGLVSKETDDFHCSLF